MFLVFDVGGTFIKYAWMTGEGEILEKGKHKTPVGPESTLDEFMSIIVSVYQTFKAKGEVEGIAMDLPGQIDVEKGHVIIGGAIYYMRDLPLASIISDACDGVAVSIENDAKAAALAEVWMGSAKGAKCAVIVALGTGVGGGVVIDGKVHHGKDMLAGEFSFVLTHVDRDRIDDYIPIGDHKSVLTAFEDKAPIASTYMATSSLCFRAAKIKGLAYEDVNGELIYKWAKAGDKEMQDLLEDFYYEIAKFAINVYTILNPDIILFGGGISAEPAFLEGVDRYIKRLVRISSQIYGDIRIDTCKFRNDSNLLGALCNFKQQHGMLD